MTINTDTPSLAQSLPDLQRPPVDEAPSDGIQKFSEEFAKTLVMAQEFFPLIGGVVVDFLKDEAEVDPLKDEGDRISQWHWLWVAPANFVANMIGFALAPVIAIIHALAAAVFGAVGFFSEDAYSAANIEGRAALVTLMLGGVNFVNAFVPQSIPLNHS